LRGSKIERSTRLRAYVEDRLAMGWSPEQIAGRMEREGSGHVIIIEPIYRHAYSPAGRRAGLPRRRPPPYEFKKRVFDLSYAIAAELRRMRAEYSKTPDRIQVSAFEISDHPQTLLSVPKKTVFLAQVTDDLHKQRDSVKHYLNRSEQFCH
jgi:IS30 family transposase